MRRKSWSELTITDDYMFKLVMSHKNICKHLVEKILGIKIKEIKYLENEKSFKNTYENKGIRLDVYAEDEDNSRFILEMQVKDYGKEELAKRARYYQSSIDYDFLLAGHNYKELSNVAVIFFCPFKLFDGKRRMYTFVNTCKEDKNIILKDGVTKIMLSSAGEKTDDIDDDIAAFLDYMNGIVENNSFISEVDETIRVMKNDGVREADYMTIRMIMDEEREEGFRDGMEKGIEKGREEGMEKGREEGMEKGMEKGTLSSIQSLMESMKWTVDQAMDALKISSSDRLRYKAAFGL